MSKWIRKGDNVLVIAGNDKGKQGEVLGRAVDRILVKGVNVRKKHMKRTPESQGGRIVEMEVPIHISNVALCDKDGKKIKKAKETQLVHKEEGSVEKKVHRSVKKKA